LHGVDVMVPQAGDQPGTARVEDEPAPRDPAGRRDVGDLPGREVDVDRVREAGEPRIGDDVDPVSGGCRHVATARAAAIWSCARRISAASPGLAYGPSPESSAITVSTISGVLFWLSLRLATTRVGVRRNPTVPFSSRSTNSGVFGGAHMRRGSDRRLSK